VAADLKNPIDVACSNPSCNATPGAPCITVGRFISATPHTPRIRLAIEGPRVKGRRPPELASLEDWQTASYQYTARMLAGITGREPTEAEIARARREGSLRADKGLLRALAIPALILLKSESLSLVEEPPRDARDVLSLFADVPPFRMAR
jgi:hypothetical protein